MSCEKSSFKTAEEARATLMHIVENGKGKNKKPCRYYQCPECGDWHLTSSINVK